jgi:inhibitor of KinA
MYPIRFLDSGEAALVVEFGETVDPAINDRVLALDAAFVAAQLAGVRETVPTYRSLMIHYDPLAIDRASLVEAVLALDKPGARGKAKARWTFPCCYDEKYGEDINAIADMTGLSAGKVVSLHSGAHYRIYMYGFAPGFAYLGGLPEELAVSRRASPRPPHPPNTILIGGGLSLVATVPMPTGWWLIGRTPERMFSMARHEPFLASVGDELRFEPVDVAAFAALEARAEAGETIARKDVII